MRNTKHILWVGTIGLVFGLLFLAAACSSTSSTSFQDQIVTKDNSTELANEAKRELSYEDYELLQGFIHRVYPDQPEGSLPVGMPVSTMIQSQKAFLEAQADNGAGAQPTGAAAGAEALAPSTEQSATTSQPPAAQPAPAKSAEKRRAPEPEPRQQTSTSPSSASAPEPEATREPPAPSTTQMAQATADEPVGQAGRTAPVAPPPPEPPPAPRQVVVPSGETLTIRLAQALSSKTARGGQRFEGTLDKDLDVGGQLVAPAGSRVIGRVTEVVPSGKVKGKASMSLDLTGLEVGDQIYDISTQNLSFEAQGTGKEDAKKVGIASGIGAIIGAIAGGGKGAAIGATIGAGAGTGVVLATPGDEVEFPNEQRMVFKLNRSVEMPVE